MSLIALLTIKVLSVSGTFTVYRITNYSLVSVTNSALNYKTQPPFMARYLPPNCSRN